MSPQFTKSSNFGHGKFPNERLDREDKHFKLESGVEAGWKFDKMDKIKNIRDSAEILLP